MLSHDLEMRSFCLSPHLGHVWSLHVMKHIIPQGKQKTSVSHAHHLGLVRISACCEIKTEAYNMYNVFDLNGYFLIWDGLRT